jgi:anti-sigma regulatory factor (Ser/Thr protein kinase)
METEAAPGLLVQALEHLADAVLLCRAWYDPEGIPVDIQVIWANPRAEAAHLGHEGSLVGRRWTQLYPRCTEDGLLATALAVLTGRDAADGEVTLGGDAAARPGEYQYHGELLPQATLLWVLRDISDRHQVTADLADRERRLTRALIKLQGLQDVTAALGGAVTVTDVAQVVTDITFDVLGVSRGGLALLDPRREALVFRRLSGVSPTWRDRWTTIPMSQDCPMSCAFRTRHPVYLRDLAELQERWPRLEPVMTGEARTILPLVADRPLGAIILVWDRVKDFSDSERLFLSTMAAQCALALARVQLFEAQATAAHNLQRALLPSELPKLAGVESAARYYTADGDAVGGDWYDMFALPSGGIGLVIGDVEGHSSAAAAIMGQARNVIRAYSAETNTPAEVLTRASRFLALHTDVLVTCCYLELRPDERILTAASAGHPGPVIAEPGGPARQLDVVPGPPLGVLEHHDYAELTVLLPPGSTLTLFTDGLVEQHPRRRHGGLPELLSTATRLADRPPDLLADELAELIDDQSAVDDTAVLVVRLTEDAGTGRRGHGGHAATPWSGRDGAPACATRVFGPSRAATPAARHFVRDVLRAWGLDGLTDQAELVVSELVTNAVMHTAGRVQLTLRRHGREAVWIGVRDDSDRLPRRQSPTADDVAGRGLAIVAQLADRWGVEPSASGTGKTVWLELRARRNGHTGHAA